MYGYRQNNRVTWFDQPIQVLIGSPCIIYLATAIPYVTLTIIRGHPFNLHSNLNILCPNLVIPIFLSPTQPRKIHIRLFPLTTIFC